MSNSTVVQNKGGRLDYIDVIKGIGILLVCLGHSIAITDAPLNMFILSFHMPLFFFVSGMLFYGKDLSGVPFTKFVKKKAFTILVPQLTCAFIGFAERILWYVIITKEMQFKDVISFNLLGWFLIALFFMEIIMWCALRTNSKFRPVIFMVVGLAMFFVIPSIRDAINIPANACVDYFWKIAEQTTVAVIFGFAGMYAFPLAEKYRQNVKYHGMGLFLLCLVAFLSMQNSPIEMYVNDYGNKVAFILIAFLGIIATVDIAMLFDKSKILITCGQNSIVIYVFQFAMTTILVGLSRKVLGWKTGQYPYFMIIFLCVVVLLIPIVWFANKYLPFLFGKKKQSK